MKKPDKNLKHLHELFRLKSKRPLRDPIIWTHAFFLINIGLYLSSTYKSIGVLFALSTFASFKYHRSYEISRWWRRADEILAQSTLAYIFAHATLCCSWKQIGLLVLWTLVSIVVWDEGRRAYTLMHSLWHVLVFGGNVIAWSYLPPICLI